MRPTHDSLVDRPSSPKLKSADKNADDARNEMRDRVSSSWELDIHERPTLIP